MGLGLTIVPTSLGQLSTVLTTTNSASPGKTLSKYLALIMIFQITLLYRTPSSIGKYAPLSEVHPQTGQKSSALFCITMSPS
ncbi:hypothetical protein THIOM_005433 [Candidatus Thiomargarita nelsonii]|uniref:Uncharacterized protein n=1 Tax=Candidatus Thiomargarita nelsonii TaxID=1003181 RepID=A0A176RTA0_9GAMM|nr:hypothetical protein THIOM_005433 [Candidatus Thiomargarita nelsonii]